MNRILLADDHEIIRSGLKLFISTPVPHSIIDEAWNGNSALQLIKENEYQLIILDVIMPATDSFGLVSNIISINPDAKILMFSMNAEEVYAKRYLQLGAKGYISKTASFAELGSAIYAVLNNDRYIGPVLNQLLTEEALGIKATNNPFAKLSTREFEIALHIINGESITVICKTFSLQSSTVGTYKARIFEKLNCKNTIEINRLARIYNIIPQR
jgi:DNA-binding NarL/FixJ family response regulator